jgi:transposase
MDVVIGIDAHKRTHTLVAVDAGGRKLGTKTVAATTEGHRAGLNWATDTFGGDLRWGVEDVRAMTARLETDLMDGGQTVTRVPTRLMARIRHSGREFGKSDPIDALAVARAVLANPDWPVARHSPGSRDIKLLADRRDDLVQHRTAMTNRLLWHIHEVDPTHVLAPRSLIALKNQVALAEWLAPIPGVIAEIARAELGDIAAITPQINDLHRRLAPLVVSAAASLLQLHGCGTLTGARIIGETADIARFRSEAAFARYAGVTPVPQWSGSTAGRMRSHMGGNRALNAALHQIAVIRIMPGGPDEADYRSRRQTERHATVMRRLKRRLVRIVYKRLRADQPCGSAWFTELERRNQAWAQHVAAVPFSMTRACRVRAVSSRALPELRSLDEITTHWQQALTGTVGTTDAEPMTMR